MRRARNLLLGIIGQMLVWGSCIAAEVKNTKGLNIVLLSEQGSITAGSKFTLGVRIKHEEGFHTYWKNPGHVGMATSVKWKLPEGFTAGAIQWPFPEVTSMAGHPCHGYERDVMLLVEVQAPERISGNEVKLTAGLAWMCCADDCFPGFADLSLILPVTEKLLIDKQNAVAFSKARGELTQTDSPWNVEVLSARDESIIKFRLTMKTKGEGAPDYIFSDDGQISSNKKQQFIKQADGSYLFSIDRSEYSPKLCKEFTGVLKVGKQHYSFLSTYKN